MIPDESSGSLGPLTPRSSSFIPPERKQLGDLKILPKSEIKKAKKESKVITVRHDAHVTYDASTRRYHGLPAAWENELKKQFGLPPSLVEKEQVDGYDHPLPSILIFMKQYLFTHGGLETQGVFRLAPDGDECSKVKQQLDQGTFKEARDINVFANLIKVWFRELPSSIMNVIDSDSILSCHTSERAWEILEQFPEPNRSIIFWLVDMCVEVTEYSGVNKMTAKNLAIVIAPNLYRPPQIFQKSHSEALESIKFCKGYTDFFEMAVEWRIQHKPGKLPSPKGGGAGIAPIVALAPVEPVEPGGEPASPVAAAEPASPVAAEPPAQPPAAEPVEGAPGPAMAEESREAE